MHSHFKYFLCFLLLLCGIPVSAQTDSSAFHRQRKREAIVFSGMGLFYGGVGAGLYFAWYRDYPFQRFHFFNDNREWLQMDKAGHAFTCYTEGVNGMQLMQWAGLPEKKALWAGGMVGMGVQTIVEMLDGRSSKWGFSWGDMAANTAGTFLGISQQYYWKEQRVQLRYSYHPESLRKIRPSMLGENTLSALIKDYNAQTYWLSFQVKPFFPESRWPAWLQFSLGYGAYGMLTGSPDDNNIFVSKGQTFDYSGIQRYRKFYFSPDIILEKIPYIQHHRKLYAAARLLSCLKIPMPTLEFSKNGTRGYILYF